MCETSNVQAHVHQRAMNRWVDERPLIHNYCWPGQLNSSHPALVEQCNYNQSSVWQEFTRTYGLVRLVFTSSRPDPYATPAFGACSKNQLTKQGILNSEKLGRLLKRQYMERNELIPTNCAPEYISLELDMDQKNQFTMQHEYFGLCRIFFRDSVDTLGGRFPSLADYPVHTTLNTGHVEKGKPFWLSTSICNNSKFQEMLKESQEQMYNSVYWNEEVHDVTLLAAHHTGTPKLTFVKVTLLDHDNPESKDRADFLDSIADCLFVHQCHNLTDYPGIFKDAEELFQRMDNLETLSRLYPYDYFAMIDEAKFFEFSSYYFGYYYKVLYDRYIGSLHVT